MKRIILLVSFLLVVVTLNAQRVDLDRFFVQGRFTNLPQKPLGLDYKTFKAEATFTSGMSKYFLPEEVVNNFSIEGFQNVTENPDLTLKFNAEDIMLYRTEVKNRVEETKDKDGKVTGRKTLYWFEIEYSMSAKYELFDNKANKSVGTSRVDNRENKYIFKSTETNSYNGARDFYYLNKDMVIKNIISERFADYYKAINNELTVNYGYKIVNDNQQLWILGSKKHPEFEEYNRIAVSIKDALANMSPSSTIDPVAEALKPAIEYLNGIATKYSADEKTDRKMRYSAYYNLAKIYMFLDMPDQAIEMGNRIIANDYDGKDGKHIADAANALKALFAKNNMTSRHFER